MNSQFPATVVSFFLCFLPISAETTPHQWSDVYQGTSHTGSISSRDIERLAVATSRAGGPLSPSPRKAPGTLSSKWIERITNMPDYLKAFYVTYGEKVHEVLNGQQNWLSDPTKGYVNGGKYVTEITTYQGTVAFTFPQDATTDVVREAAALTIQPICGGQWTEANNFLSYLSMSLTYDYPEGFWLDSSFKWGDSWSYRYSYNTSMGTGSIEYSHTIYFTLWEQDFDHRRQEFQTPERVASAVEEYNQAVSQIAGDSPDNSRRAQISYFNTWLTMHNSYNSLYGHTNDIPTIVWSPLSALRGNTGDVGPVCEGYARAFKVLCDQKNIPCMLVVGFAKNSAGDSGESHMWNEVQMEDGKWYAVDVTWNDPVDELNRKVSGYETDFWLLLGKKDLVAPGFTFEQSHPNGLTWGTDPAMVALWDYSAESLIADNKYFPNTGICVPSPAFASAAPLRVFTTSGRYVGTFQSMQAARQQLPAGELLIVNGKKRF